MPKFYETPEVGAIVSTRGSRKRDAFQARPSRPTPRSNPTFTRHLRKWIKMAKPTLRISTWEGYLSNIEKHIIPSLGHFRLNELTPQRLNRFYADLLANGRLRKEGGLAPRTVRLNHLIIRRALEDAVRWGIMAKNVADYADPPRLWSYYTTFETWSPGEVRRFLNHSAAHRLYPAWLLLATTGARRGEILGLRWQDIDLRGKCLSIRQSLLAVHHRPVISLPKTKHGRRTIPIPESVCTVLGSHLRRQKAECRRRKEAFREDDFLFTKPDGSFFHPDRLSREFKRLAREAGLKPIRLQDLRHTWATLALGAGIHPKVVGDILGHSGITVTIDIYSHVLPRVSADATSKVTRLFA